MFLVKVDVLYLKLLGAAGLAMLWEYRWGEVQKLSSTVSLQSFQLEC